MKHFVQEITTLINIRQFDDELYLMNASSSLIEHDEMKHFVQEITILMIDDNFMMIFLKFVCHHRCRS